MRFLGKEWKNYVYATAERYQRANGKAVNMAAREGETRLSMMDEL
jgi:hypothetical protein